MLACLLCMPCHGRTSQISHTVHRLYHTRTAKFPPYALIPFVLFWKKNNGEKKKQSAMHSALKLVLPLSSRLDLICLFVCILCLSGPWCVFCYSEFRTKINYCRIRLRIRFRVDPRFIRFGFSVSFVNNTHRSHPLSLRELGNGWVTVGKDFKTPHTFKQSSSIHAPERQSHQRTWFRAKMCCSPSDTWDCNDGV